MPREDRVEYPRAIYHVTVRMVGSAWESGREQNRDLHLFRNDEDRVRFLDQLGESRREYVRFVEEPLLEPDIEVESLMRASSLGTGGAVGRQLRRLEEMLRNRRQLRRQVSSCESALESERGRASKCYVGG